MYVKRLCSNFLTVHFGIVFDSTWLEDLSSNDALFYIHMKERNDWWKLQQHPPYSNTLCQRMNYSNATMIDKVLYKLLSITIIYRATIIAGPQAIVHIWTWINRSKKEGTDGVGGS